jgi:hypothetical protein
MLKQACSSYSIYRVSNIVLSLGVRRPRGNQRALFLGGIPEAGDVAHQGIASPPALQHGQAPPQPQPGVNAKGYLQVSAFIFEYPIPIVFP